MECSSWDNIIVCYSREIIASVWPRTKQLNITLSLFAFQNKILHPKICTCVTGLREKNIFFVVYLVFKNWVLLCWQSYLFYNCNSEGSSDSVKMIFSLLPFFSVYLHNYNHSVTQLFVCLSPWHVFINDLFCKKLSRSVKFQHAMNQVAQIYFSTSH